VTGRQVGARAVIPLFPLGTVLVPGLVLPLHVFEPRYRQLVTDVSARHEGDRGFGVIAIREGHEVGGTGVRALYEVGTLALVRTVVPYPDGRSDLVTNGDARFRLLRLVDAGTPYHCGEVEWLDEADGAPDADIAVLAHAVSRRFDARMLSYLVAVAMVLDLSDRQALLQAVSTSDRLQAELGMLGRETGLVRALPSLPAIDLARTPSGLN
jgi:Lon protease-like protein